MYSVMFHHEFLLYAPLYKANNPAVVDQIDAFCADKSIVYVVHDDARSELIAVHDNEMMIFDGMSEKYFAGENSQVLSRLLMDRDRNAKAIAVVQAEREAEREQKSIDRSNVTKTLVREPPQDSGSWREAMTKVGKFLKGGN